MRIKQHKPPNGPFQRKYWLPASSGIQYYALYLHHQRPPPPSSQQNKMVNQGSPQSEVAKTKIISASKTRKLGYKKEDAVSSRLASFARSNVALRTRRCGYKKNPRISRERSPPWSSDWLYNNMTGSLLCVVYLVGFTRHGTHLVGLALSSTWALTQFAVRLAAGMCFTACVVWPIQEVANHTDLMLQAVDADYKDLCARLLQSSQDPAQQQHPVGLRAVPKTQDVVAACAPWRSGITRLTHMGQRVWPWTLECGECVSA
jgi:hypothetical protein